MFDYVKRRIRDMATIKFLCLTAERLARAGGDPEPGAEHFLLAAIEMPEGSARRALQRLSVDPSGVKNAIARQYADALRQVGIEPDASDPDSEPLGPPRSHLYRAKPSVGKMMRSLAALARSDGVPLLGAHVVAAIASMEHGVAPRTLRALGVEPGALLAAAQAEITDSHHRPRTPA